MKVHCSVLAEDAIKAAVADWRSKKTKKTGDAAPAAAATAEAAE